MFSFMRYPPLSTFSSSRRRLCHGFGTKSLSHQQPGKNTLRRRNTIAITITPFSKQPCFVLSLFLSSVSSSVCSITSTGTRVAGQSKMCRPFWIWRLKHLLGALFLFPCSKGSLSSSSSVKKKKDSGSHSSSELGAPSTSFFLAIPSLLTLLFSPRDQFSTWFPMLYPLVPGCSSVSWRIL